MIDKKHKIIVIILIILIMYILLCIYYKYKNNNILSIIDNECGEPINKKNDILMIQNKCPLKINKNNKEYCKQKNIDYYNYNINNKIECIRFIKYIFNNYDYEYVIYLENNLKIIDFLKDIRYIIQQGGDNDLILSRDEYDTTSLSLDVIIFRKSQWTLYKLENIYNALLYNKLTNNIILDQVYTKYVKTPFNNVKVKTSLDIGFPYFLQGICVYNEHAFNSTKSSFIIKMLDDDVNKSNVTIDIYPWKDIPNFVVIDKNLSNLPTVEYDGNNRHIPKYIFQTMETSLLSNDMNNYSRKNLLRLNPNYNYFYFDSLDCRNFIKENFDKHVFKAYDMLLPGAFKSDLWRCCVIYKYGGVYCDSRLLPIKGFDSFIENDLDFISPQDTYHGVWQGFFASKPKSEILLKTINLICEDVLNYVYISKYGSRQIRPMLAVTGPEKMGAAINLVINRNFDTVFEPGVYKINNIKFKILTFNNLNKDKKNLTRPFITDITTKETLMISKYSDYYKINDDLFWCLCGKESYNTAWINRNIYKLDLII